MTHQMCGTSTQWHIQPSKESADTCTTWMNPENVMLHQKPATKGYRLCEPIDTDV